MDPNATHQGPSRHGGVAAPPASAELGQVVAVDSARMAYVVRTLRGRPLTGVPRKRSSQADLALLPVGASVVVRFDLGFPYIDGVLDLPAAPSDDAGVPVTGVDGYSSPTTDFTTGNFRGPGEPSDLLAGDTVLGNKAGARVGVLEGGVAMLAGSGMAQVRAHALNDLVEVVSRNFRQVTDMGISEIKNTDGRINWSFRGASDQTNEAGADEENWTVRWDLGSEGDMLNFELTTPQGQTLFRFHVDSNGRAEIFGLDGVVIQSGCQNDEPHIAEHGGDSTDTVHGNRTLNTGGNRTETVEGQSTTTIDGGRSEVVGGDASTAAVRDIGISAGRNTHRTTAGAKDGSVALREAVLGGGYAVTIGQPAYPSPGYSLQTLRGDIDFESTLGGDFRVNTPTGNVKTNSRKVTLVTTLPDSVVLGGHSLASHVAKFEQLEVFLKALLKWCDTHAHPPGAPVGGPPTVSASMLLSGLIAPIKSVRVGVGG